MVFNAIKKVLGISVSTAIIAASVPLSAYAADRQERGNIDGYDYELWNQDNKGDIEFEPGAGTFTFSWDNIENVLANMGKNYSEQKKNYKAISNLSFSYDLEFTPNGNAFFGAYGWTQNPLVEYYIIDGWGSWRPASSSEKLGTAIVNGHEYEVFKNNRFNQPSLSGPATFCQYWSVRKINSVYDNNTNRVSDRIDISKHFDSWDALGLDVSGTLYNAVFDIEAYRSKGSAELKKLVLGDGRDATPVSVHTDAYNVVPMSSSADGYFLVYDFENYIDDWKGRDNERLNASSEHYEGNLSLCVYNRHSSWQGPIFPADPRALVAGDSYSIGAYVMQDQAESVDFNLVLQYLDTNGRYQYQLVAEAEAGTGKWVKLVNTSFTLPTDSKDYKFFIETPDYVGDFYVDNAYVGLKDTKPFRRTADPDDEISKLGDINCDGIIDIFDLPLLRKAVLKFLADGTTPPANADINNDGTVNVADLVSLQRFLLGYEDFDAPAETTTTTEATTTTTTTTTTTAATTTTTAASTTTAAAVTTTSAATTASKASYKFNAQYIETGGKYGETYPKTGIIKSRDELESYLSDYFDSLKTKDFSPESYYSKIYSEAIKQYTDEWFKEHKLAVVLLDVGFSAPDTYKVSYVTKDEIGIELLKNGGDMKMSYWHIFIEVDKDTDINDGFKVAVSNLSVKKP